MHDVILSVIGAVAAVQAIIAALWLITAWSDRNPVVAPWMLLTLSVAAVAVVVAVS